MEKQLKRTDFVNFEMTGYRGIDTHLTKAQNILKEVRVSSAKGRFVDRDRLSARLLSYVERINKLSNPNRYKRTEDQAFEQARQDALQAIWQAYQWVTVKVDASTLGEMDDDSHADVFLHTMGSKNPNMDFDTLPDPSPHASEVQIVSLDQIMEDSSHELNGEDQVRYDANHLHGLEWEAAPAEGFDDEEVHGFWRDPRELGAKPPTETVKPSQDKWSKLGVG